MYTPPAFAETDRTRLAAFIRAHDFGLLVRRTAAGLGASHLPFLLDEAGGRLVAHVARANDQWVGIEEAGPVLVVFTGAHGYVSPRWYATRPAVPTWNYEAVHVTGAARAIHDPEALRPILDGLSRIHEAGAAEPWSLDAAPADFIARQIAGIVGIEIAIEQIEGKRKLSQNRPAADRRGVVAALDRQGDDRSRALAAAMRDVP